MDFTNDSIKMVLTQLHALCESVQEDGEKCIKYWAEVKDLPIEHSQRIRAMKAVEEMAEEALDSVSRASMLCSCLHMMTPNLRERNAVVQNAVKAVSEGYGKLLKIQQVLQDLVG